MPTKKFKPGVSGNKAGRPPGIKDRRVELRELLRPHAADLIQTAVNLALGGDQTALRMCLDRICPTMKAVSEPIAVPVPTTGTLDEQAAVVYKLASSGTLSTDDAAQLIGMIQNQCRIKELTDMEARLKVLETQAGETSNGKFRK